MLAAVFGYVEPFVPYCTTKLLAAESLDPAEASAQEMERLLEAMEEKRRVVASAGTPLSVVVLMEADVPTPPLFTASTRK